ncbi:hypothetical protein C8R44DRAFT_866236 [Mycena epipterygia]|nr:hypothetical protein C8R44DRAFT_866236 [Mycena epipterygia]
MAGGNDPPRWVKSPHPPTEFYFRPNTGSRWRGPRDNRTWVPAMDAPFDFPPPPDDFADCDPDVAMPAAPPTGVSHFGGVASLPPSTTGPIVPMPPQPGPPPVRMEPPRRTPEPTTPVQRAEPPSRWNGANPYSGSSGYSGPFAHTIAVRDRGRYINRPVEYPRTEDSASRHRDNDGHCVDEWRSDYARRGPDYPHREYDDRNHDDRDDRDYRSSSTRTLSPRAPRTDPLRPFKIRRDLSRFFASARSGPAQSVPPAQAAPSAPPTPFVALPAPDVLAAPRDSNGLPIYPEEPVPDDVSEYAGSDEESDEDTPEFNAKLRKWHNRERIRQQDVARDAAKGTKALPSTPPAMDPARTGYWGSLTYATIAEVRCLLRWMRGRCPLARAMFLHLTRWYGHQPQLPRPDGIQYLMRAQNTAESSWLVATTGNSTPLSRRRTNTNVHPRHSRNERRKYAAKLRTAGANDQDPVSRGDRDEPMPIAPAPRAHRQSYLGSSPLPPNYMHHTEGPPERGVHMGPATHLDDVMSDLASRSPLMWSEVIRREDGTWPTDDTPTRPLEDDVLADRFTHFIGPIREHGSIHRTLFEQMQMALRGQWEPASEPLEHYTYDELNMTPSMALSYVLQHGIHIGSAELRALQSYAASWWNRREGSTDPTAQLFRAEPRSVMDVLSMPDTHITEWRAIQHGPLREGQSTSYSRHPTGRGISASAHAPAPPPAITPMVDEEMPAQDKEPGELEDPEGVLDAALEVPLPDSTLLSPTDTLHAETVHSSVAYARTDIE